MQFNDFSHFLVIYRFLTRKANHPALSYKNILFFDYYLTFIIYINIGNFSLKMSYTLILFSGINKNVGKRLFSIQIKNKKNIVKKCQ